MEELIKVHKQWKNFIPDREAARAALTNGNSPTAQKYQEKKLELAKLRAEVALLKAQHDVEQHGYSKPIFDAEWAEKKKDLKAKLEELIAAELHKGKKPAQLASELGSKNLMMFYDVKANVDHYRNEQADVADGADWQWSRFSGAQRYALAKVHGEWGLVLMHGTEGTDLEGEKCVFDYNTGAYISGSVPVFNSDTEENRKKRSVTLASVLDQTYAGRVKEIPNPYFEEV
jgi:hypothetical protein